MNPRDQALRRTVAGRSIVVHAYIRSGLQCFEHPLIKVCGTSLGSFRGKDLSHIVHSGQKLYPVVKIIRTLK